MELNSLSQSLFLFLHLLIETPIQFQTNMTLKELYLKN